MKTELNDYTLWYDGYVEISPNDVLKYIKFDKLCVTKINDELIKYNKLTDNKIEVKTKLNNFDTSWIIPKKYQDIDIEEYIMSKFVNKEFLLNDNEIVQRYNRIKYELSIFNKLNLFNLLKTMIYVIDMFKENKIVWGVGRGSSVSSYVLYLLEVHDIDSIQYELDFDDFLSLE